MENEKEKIDVKQQMVKAIKDVQSKTATLVKRGIKDSYFAQVSSIFTEDYYLQFCSESTNEIHAELLINQNDLKHLSEEKKALIENLGWQNPDKNPYFQGKAYWRVFSVADEKDLYNVAEIFLENLKKIFGYQKDQPLKIEVDRFNRKSGLAGVLIERDFEALSKDILTPIYNQLEKVVNKFHTFLLILTICGLLWITFLSDVGNLEKILFLTVYFLTIFLHGSRRYRAGRQDALELGTLTKELIKKLDSYKGKKSD